MEVGNILDNRYEIIEIKKGGLGIVYIAKDILWDELVAIKTFQNIIEFNEFNKSQFISESRNWINIGYHPYIVLAKYYKTISNIPYLFLEYVQGSTLSELKNTNQPIPRLIDLSIQICESLKYIHDKFNMIHRDIKPDNIFVCKEKAGEHRIIKLTDFGLSKVLFPGNIIKDIKNIPSPSDTTSQEKQGLMGSIFYLAPEVILGDKNIDFRSDIYSLGITLFELFTGKLPFYPDYHQDIEKTKESILLKHLKQKPVEPRKINASIPKILSKLIMKCIEKNRRSRYQSYDEIISDLKKIYKDVKDKKIPTSQDYFEITIKPIHSELALLNNKAASLSELGKHDEALSIYDEILKQTPNDIFALCNKALILKMFNRYEESIESLNKALLLNSEDAETWSILSEVLRSNKRYMDALACCNTAIKINPNEPSYLKEKARVVEAKGDIDQAINIYKQIINMTSNNFEGWHELGLLYQNKKDYQSSIDCYKKALSINGKYAFSWVNLGIVYSILDYSNEAEECFSKAIAFNPYDPQTWNNIGTHYANNNIFDKAKEYFLKALELNPNYELAKQNLKKCSI